MKEITTMKKNYKDYIITVTCIGLIGAGYHEVTASKMLRTPSGLNEYITINGVSVKARHCEVVQVFVK